jgi:hypothetical protein
VTEIVEATDLRGRTAWRTLLDQASRRKIDLILVWKLNRAFRSVAHASATLDQLRRWGVGLRSYTEAWLDTSGVSPWGDLLFNILASFAQFERARRQGKHVGRPRAVDGEWKAIRPLILDRTLSRIGAAARQPEHSQPTHGAKGWSNDSSETPRQHAVSGCVSTCAEGNPFETP